MRELNRLWRVFGTGLSFVVFGLAGLILGVLVFPLFGLVVRDVDARRRVARSIISWTFRRFIGLMHGLGLFSYELLGFEKLDGKGRLVLANHPSLIDTVFLMGFIPNVTGIVSEALFRNPFTVGPLGAAGMIRNNSGVDVIDQCNVALSTGTSVLIFPEGTRTPKDGSIRLQRGAAHIAVRTGHDVTPIIIKCVPRTLMKGDKWWHVAPSAPHYSLQVGDDIAVHEFCTPIDGPAMAARRLTAYLQQHLSTTSLAHAVPGN